MVAVYFSLHTLNYSVCKEAHESGLLLIVIMNDIYGYISCCCLNNTNIKSKLVSVFFYLSCIQMS